MRKILAMTAAVLTIPMLMAAETEDGFIHLTPDELDWITTDTGTSLVRLEGSSAEEGFYILRVRFPPGSSTTPHYHDQDRYITVLSGTWYSATSADATMEEMVRLPAGSYMMHPAGGWHFDGARDEEVIVEIRGMGPVQTFRE